ncbi:hypothetical protein [Sphingomonas sp. PB4P5]|uniref:hypothetical protein n=1 Tax=Parasphingomonas puruogangriensis TaxID=3096155 RepID=UPI002FCB33DF
MTDATTTPTNTVSADTSNKKTGLSDAFRTHFAGDAPITDKAKNFAKAKPWASAALLGVAAVALLNTFRGTRG